MHVNCNIFNKLGFVGWGLVGNRYIRWNEGKKTETTVA